MKVLKVLWKLRCKLLSSIKSYLFITFIIVIFFSSSYSVNLLNCFSFLSSLFSLPANCTCFLSIFSLFSSLSSSTYLSLPIIFMFPFDSLFLPLLILSCSTSSFTLFCVTFLSFHSTSHLMPLPFPHTTLIIPLLIPSPPLLLVSLFSFSTHLPVFIQPSFPLFSMFLSLFLPFSPLISFLHCPSIYTLSPIPFSALFPPFVLPFSSYTSSPTLGSPSSAPSYAWARLQNEIKVTQRSCLSVTKIRSTKSRKKVL